MKRVDFPTLGKPTRPILYFIIKEHYSLYKKIRYEKKECLFCEIGEKKRKAYIITENEKIISFLDNNPVADGHILIVTKKHFSNFFELDDENWREINCVLKVLVEKQKKYLNVKNFNVISNMGNLASQSVFHFHLHLIPKYEKKSGFLWTVRTNNIFSLEEVFNKLSQTLN